MTPCSFALPDLLPHAAPMILIDEATAHDGAHFVAAVTVTPGRLFHIAGRGMPAHIAIEWMAQACAASVGARALTQGLPVKVGLLLGTRNFSATVPWFADGQRLIVTVSETYNDANMAVFDCEVAEDNATGTAAPLASAKLTVYQPDDVLTLLKLRTNEAP